MRQKFSIEKKKHFLFIQIYLWGLEGVGYVDPPPTDSAVSKIFTKIFFQFLITHFISTSD